MVAACNQSSPERTRQSTHELPDADEFAVSSSPNTNVVGVDGAGVGQYRVTFHARVRSEVAMWS